MRKNLSVILDKVLGKFSIRAKLIITFLFVLSLSASFLFLTQSSVQSLKKMVIQLYDEVLMSGNYALSAKFRFEKFNSDIRSAILASNKTDFEQNIANAKEDLISFNEDLDIVKQRAYVPEYKVIVSKIQEDIPKIEKDIESLSTGLAPLFNAEIKNDYSSNIKILRSWDADEKRSKISETLFDLSDKATAAGYDFRNTSVEKSNAIEKAALFSGLVIIIFIAISAMLLLISLLRPLKKITNACIDIGSGNFGIKVEINTKDEFATLANAFNSMIATINEKSSLLKGEIRTVSNLLNNMQQAVFAVDRDGLIVSPASKYTETLLGMMPVGESIYKTIFKSIDEKSEVYSGIINAMVSVYDSDQLQWELSEHLFPKKIKYFQNGDEKNSKIFKVAYNALYDSNENVEKVLFVVEDVTQIELLEAGVKEARAAAIKSVDIIQEVTRLEPDEAESFFSSCRRLLLEMGKIRETSTFDPQNSSVLMRDLHTIKGNARMIKFSHLSTCVHVAEGSISELVNELKRDSSLSATSIIKQVNEVYDKLIQEISTYAKFSSMILGVGTDWVKDEDGNISKKNSNMVLQVQEVLYRKMLEYIQLLKKQNEPLSIKEIHNLAEMLQNLTNTPIRPLFFKLTSMAKDLADKFNKKINVSLKGEDTFITPSQMSLLQDAMVHIVRNSLDHGIEFIEERKNRGKNEISNLDLICSRDGEKVVVKVCDDGRGIDGNLIAEKAAKQGRISSEDLTKMSLEEKISLVFLPSFSSRDEVSDISGRGVGMDAVKSMIEGAGGKVNLKSELGKGTQIILTI